MIDITDAELVQDEFARRFPGLAISTTRLDDWMDGQPNEVRTAHFNELKTVLDSDALQREFGDWKRRILFTLAIGMSHGVKIEETEITGLRTALLLIGEFETYLKSRANLAANPKPLQAQHNKI